MKNELLKVDVTYPLTSDCERIAKDVIKLKLAVCVQISLPFKASIHGMAALKMIKSNA